MPQRCECVVQDLDSQTQPWDTSKQPPRQILHSSQLLITRRDGISAEITPASPHTSPPDLDTASRKASYKAHLRN